MSAAAVFESYASSASESATQPPKRQFLRASAEEPAHTHAASAFCAQQQDAGAVSSAQEGGAVESGWRNRAC